MIISMWMNPAAQTFLDHLDSLDCFDIKGPTATSCHLTGRWPISPQLVSLGQVVESVCMVSHSALTMWISALPIHIYGCMCAADLVVDMVMWSACYLDQPTRGGTAQELAMIQVKAQPVAAWDAVNLKLPMGLQTTMYLSTASTTRDHRETCPVDKTDKRRCVWHIWAHQLGGC